MVKCQNSTIQQRKLCDQESNKEEQAIKSQRCLAESALRGVRDCFKAAKPLQLQLNEDFTSSIWDNPDPQSLTINEDPAEESRNTSNM